MIRVFIKQRTRTDFAVLAAAGMLLAAPAGAQDFTVQSGQTVGPQTMNNAGDTGVIEPGGTLNAVNRGVQMLNIDQTFTNGGAISTTGGNAIHSLGDNAVIENSGTITAGDIGIVAAGRNSRVGNSGTIRTTGNSNNGITSDGDNGWVSNSGVISTAGNNSHGIYSDRVNARIHNSGSIHVSGVLSRGIASDHDGQVTNAGRIVSEQSAAIEFFGANDNILTLLAGSVIEGGLAFGGGTDTLIIGNGLSIAYTFDKAPEALSTSGAPFAVSGSVVAVVDPTTLAAEDEALADLTGGISSAVLGRLSGARTSGGGARGRDTWVQGFGALRQQTGGGAAVDTDLRLAGLVSGMDAAYAAGTRAGFFLGGARGEIEHAFNTDKTGIDSFYVGVYASTRVGSTAFDFVLTGGYSDYDRERAVGNNLAAGGIDTASADYGGWFVSPEVTVTRPVSPFGVRLEQVLTLRYSGLFLDGFAESGAADAFTAEGRDIHLGVARAVLALPFESRSDDGGHGRLTLTGGIEGRTQFGGGDVAGTLLGQNIVFDPGGDDSAIAGFAGVTGEHTTPDGLTAFVTLEGKVEHEGNHLVSAYGGLRWRF